MIAEITEEKHLDAIMVANNTALASSPPERAEDESLPAPNTISALKHAISKDDFGVVLGDDGGKPPPPLAAYSPPSRPTNQLAAPWHWTATPRFLWDSTFCRRVHSPKTWQPASCQDSLGI
eukprot:4668234-Prymnesium_polylepis.1